MNRPSISIIIPVFREEKNIAKVLFFINQKIKTSHETIIIYDSVFDPTVKIANEYKKLHNKQNIHVVKNSFGNKKGAMNAIKTGFVRVKGSSVVVIMADLADDIGQVDTMYALLQQGNDIVCASRFMKHGKKIGGPFIKTLLTRIACFTLFHVFKIPTHDATNAFKMYKRSLLKKIEIESTGGFEYSLEIVIKAFKKGYKITEIPTIWKDREEGKSNFKIMSWIPQYIKWYIGLVSFSFNKNNVIQHIKNSSLYWQVGLILFTCFLTFLTIGQEIKNKITLTSSLDFSWQSDAIERFLHGFISGKDYIFTYGPLFQLVYSLPSFVLKIPSYIGLLYVPILLTTIVSTLVIWLVCMITKNNLERVILSVFLLIILGLASGINGNIILRILLPMVFSVLWVKSIKASGQMLFAAIPSILGLYSYDLFIQAMLIAIGISSCAYFFSSKKRASLFPVGFPLVMIILFQLLASFVVTHDLSYMQNSLRTLQDYAFVMNSPWELGKSNYLYVFVLAQIVLLLIFIGSKQYAKEQKIIFGVLTLASLLALRIGFIRSDGGHIEMSLYTSIITVFILLLFLIKKNNILAILFFAVLFPLNPFSYNYFNNFSVKSMKTVFMTLKQKPDFFTLYSLASDNSYSPSDFTYFKDLITHNPGAVMVYPYDNYILNIDNQTYNTFPLQFYGYSHSTIEEKAVKMLSKNPPKYIIVGIDGNAVLAIDQIPNLTRNPLFTKWLLAHYVLKIQGRTYVVLQYVERKNNQDTVQNCTVYSLHIKIPQQISFIKQPIYIYTKENVRLPVKPDIFDYLIIENSKNLQAIVSLFSKESRYTNTYSTTQNIVLIKEDGFSKKKTTLTLPAIITCFF